METKVKVDSIVDHAFNPGEKQAMLRMEVHTGGGTNSFRSELFTSEELGRKIFVEKRVDWIGVPKDATVESIQALVDQHPDARIYKILSGKLILSESQRRVADYGLSGEAFEDFKKQHNIVAEEWNQECKQKMLQVFANSQLVRYGENNDQGKPADEPVLDKHNNKQYRVTYFSKEGQKDIDNRLGVAVTSDIALADNPAYVEAVEGQKVEG